MNKRAVYLQSTIKSVALYFLIILFVATHSCAQGQIYRNDTHHFKVTIPDSWVQIPDDVVKAYVGQIKQQSSIARDAIIDCAFQSKDYEEWFTGPGIMIQIGKGKFSEREIEKMTSSAAQNVLDEMKGDFDSCRSLKAGEVTYDRDNHILYMRGEGEFRSVGRIEQLSALYPTSEGFVAIHCKAESENWGKYLPVFKSIINSMKADDKYRFRASGNSIEFSKGSGDTSGRSFMRGAGVYVLIVVIAGLVNLFIVGVRKLKLRKR